MAEETQYTGNLSGAHLTAANGELDGSGTATTIKTVITGASNGTLVKTVFIKAVGNTTHGMIRLFVYDGVSVTQLLKEIDVFPITRSSINKSFEARVNLNFVLKSGYSIKATTQNAETFWVTAEGLNFAYYSSSVREDTTQYTANTSIVKIATANDNLDGTGTLGTAYTAGSSSTYKGSSIETITIKATVTNTPGMVRLYFSNGVATIIFTEIPVPSVVPDGTDQAFEHTIVFENSLDIPAGGIIMASTEQAQNFDIMVQGKDWNYAS